MLKKQQLDGACGFDDPGSHPALFQ